MDRQEGGGREESRRRWDVPAISLLTNLVARILLVALLTTLCSFLALDQPVLRSVFFAVGDFLGFLAHLTTFAAPALGPVWGAYWRSLILLVSALAAGLGFGVPLGLVAATRRDLIGKAATVVSYAGVLTPSFLLALLLMVFFVRDLGYWTGLQWIRILPSPGIPEPREILAPALTLAARPVAHVARITAAHARDELRAGYVQTARGKGLRGRRIVLRHVWPNVAVPVLGAARSSLLFSMSSLPIVEYVFGWNGVGQSLFDAVLSRQTVRAAFLLASLGATFVAVATLVEALGRRIDPRLGSSGEA
jgi:ABC-type dipeptide/oligopeptide/nickel transport system permease component